MEIIVKIKFGSHLYGTSTPDSDLDIKGIYMPSSRDILLQNIKPVILEKSSKKHGEKNNPDDVDYELYSPEKYLSCLARGQSFALEMLFAPDSAMLQSPHPKWDTIKGLAPKIFTKGAASFVNYCKQQAYKYCIKGTRLAAARFALEMLEKAELRYGTSTKLICILDILQEISHENKNLALVEIAPSVQSHIKKQLYFEICGKKAMLEGSIKRARLIAEKVVSEYGERALEAERSKGADWKALSHVVRVGYQAIEFLKYRCLTFPRPEREYLLAVRQGKIAFEIVSNEIKEIMAQVQIEEKKSSLPETYDAQIIDNFIEQLHLGVVKK